VKFSGVAEKGAPDIKAWEVGIPDDIELELQLLDWLFVLEGAGCVAETASTPLTKNHFGSREDRCWHSTFRCLSVKVQGTKESRSLLEMHGSTPSPVQSVIVSSFLPGKMKVQIEISKYLLFSH
jgi:hypothetical protein